MATTLRGFVALRRSKVKRVCRDDLPLALLNSPSDPGTREDIPHEGALPALMALLRVDDDMTRYLWDYCLSPRCAEQVQEDHGVALTMAEMRSSPLPWAPGGALDELLQETIREIAEQHEDPGIRGLAQLALDGF